MPINLMYNYLIVGISNKYVLKYIECIKECIKKTLHSLAK